MTVETVKLSEFCEHVVLYKTVFPFSDVLALNSPGFLTCKIHPDINYMEKLLV